VPSSRIGDRAVVVRERLAPKEELAPFIPKTRIESLRSGLISPNSSTRSLRSTSTERKPSESGPRRTGVAAAHQGIDELWR
jgi:hypothetical protein